MAEQSRFGVPPSGGGAPDRLKAGLQTQPGLPHETSYPGPRIRWAIFLGLALLALAIRLPRLGERPMHTDEAVNAYITGQLLAGESYHYDPRDRHGPALYAVALPLARISGATTFSTLTESALRLGPVVAGAATILLFGLSARWLGFAGAITAAVLFAIGPLPVYFSRYFIHETLFVAATIGTLLCAWRTLISGSALSAAATGLCAALMLACKETALLHFTAFAIAGTWAIYRNREPGVAQVPVWSNLVRNGFLAFGSFLFFVLLGYSWGAHSWQGSIDLLRAIPHFTARAAGEGHEKPVLYYIRMLAGGWSGIPVLGLGVIGAIGVALNLKRNPGRSSAPDASQIAREAMLVYSAAITILYSAIPYKTPWLTLNLWLPLTLLAGYGGAWLCRNAKTVVGRCALGLIALALLIGLGHDTWDRVFHRPADESNPYAYAHTSEDLLGLPQRVQELARHSASGNQLRIAVVAADPWPLPWYLRAFPQTGFWQPGQDPGAADIYVTSTEATEQLAPHLELWRPEFFGLRPGVLVLLWSNPQTEMPHD